MFRVVAVRYKPSRVGMAIAAVGPELRRACHHLVETKAAPYAKAISPVSSRRHQHYVQSWKIEDGLDTRDRGIDAIRVRAMTRLLNTSRHATVVEVGARVKLHGETYEIPGHFVLQNTLQFLHATRDQT
ncbi:MAG TPA: hypothetical protein VF174_09900 [Micromonosporaceae bacterium]